MTAYERDIAQFAALDAQVLGISMDSTYSHIAWQQHVTGTLSFPLISDYYPHGATAQAYDVFRAGPPIPGINERAVFVIDKQGKVASAQLYELGDVPDNNDALGVLRRLQSVAAAI